jgi:hypothetical protein
VGLLGCTNASPSRGTDQSPGDRLATLDVQPRHGHPERKNRPFPGSPSSHASRPPAKKGRLPEQSYPSNDQEHSFPVASSAHERNGARCSGLVMRGEKRGGKSDPWGRLLVRECDSLLEHRAPYFLQSPGKTACGGVHGAQEFSMHSNKVRLLFASLS